MVKKCAVLEISDPSENGNGSRKNTNKAMTLILRLTFSLVATHFLILIREEPLRSFMSSRDFLMITRVAIVEFFTFFNNFIKRCAYFVR